MKTLFPLFFLLVLLLSCNKELYVYNIYEMEKCLQGENQEEVVHDVFKFNEGFFYYENCQGYKEIDGVKVNWLEDKSCLQWKGIKDTPLVFPKKKRGKLIDSLTNDMLIPQRFFLVFLDKKRVLYFTNYEASRYFRKRVKSIYKDLNVSQIELDSLVNTNENVGKLDSVLQAHFKGKGWSESDFAFANYNLFNWGDSLLTFNQEIPLMEKKWRNSMKGIYKTYKDTSGFYLKAAFDKGTLKVKESEKARVGAKGLIELTFRSVNLENPTQHDSTYTNLELIVMNISDSSVNLKGAEDKGSKRRNLIIKNTFAIHPIFSFHQEPLKFTLKDKSKISQMFINIPSDGSMYKETWMIEGKDDEVKNIRKDKGWWVN